MSDGPSEREHRLLKEIEQNLRHQDRAFAWRMDALNTASARQGPQRFACHTTRQELVCVFLIVVILTALWMLLILTAGPTRIPPPTPADTAVSENGTFASADGRGCQADGMAVLVSCSEISQTRTASSVLRSGEYIRCSAGGPPRPPGPLGP